MADTEYKLKLWRGDQIGAERLAAALLHMDGFAAVDPQCPLGGPDGLKDLLCEKNGWTYVAAAYFPNDQQKFNAIRDKFRHDLTGVKANGADGLVFITNQALTPSEREELSNDAVAEGAKAIIYHLERIRALLDSPAGYGVRLEFLRIPMSLEEQLSYFSRRDTSISEELKGHTAALIAELGRRFDQLQGTNAMLNVRVAELGDLAQRTLFRLDEIPAPSDKKAPLNAASTDLGQLSIDVLCLLHSALLFDSPSPDVGTLRSRKIWIGSPGTAEEQARYVPPSPEEVRPLLEKLLSEWNAEYAGIDTKDTGERVAALARFHHAFLKIHPFTDGNGRIARYLLTAQARALLGEERRIIIEDREPYWAALANANAGDIADLTRLLTQAIFGQEFVPGSPCQMSGQACPGCRVGVMDVSADGQGVECRSCKLYVPA